MSKRVVVYDVVDDRGLTMTRANTRRIAEDLLRTSSTALLVLEVVIPVRRVWFRRLFWRLWL